MAFNLNATFAESLVLRQRLIDIGNRPPLTPLGLALLHGDSPPDGLRSEAAASLRGRFPQTVLWPLPGSGSLHPLDCIVINGVTLPLAEPPEFALTLETSERKPSGQEFSTHVSHGKKAHPVRIKLQLFRDVQLGYAGGLPVGKDWFAEYDKVSSLLVPKSLSKEHALSVSHPELADLGCVSVVFTKRPTKQHARGGIWHVSLEGLDVRAVKSGGAAKKLERNDIGTRADPAPQSQANAVAASNAFYKNLAKDATHSPSSRAKGH